MQNLAIKEYYKFMVDAAVLFGANKTTAERELYKALQFEMELAKVNENHFNFFYKNSKKIIFLDSRI